VEVSSPTAGLQVAVLPGRNVLAQTATLTSSLAWCRKELDGTILIDFLFRSEDSIPVKRLESIDQAGKAGESFL
jgi:hypothetical protein